MSDVRSYPKFKIGDVVLHILDVKWWPISSVNRICRVVDYDNELCVISPLYGDKRALEMQFVCDDEDLIPTKASE